MEEKTNKLKPKDLSVGIVGYTGESGKALTKEILQNDLFKTTVLIGRRNLKFDEEFYNKGIQKIVDFDKLSECDSAFENLDVVYCCLGTNRSLSGAGGYRKVDYDYVLESAKVARKNGVKQFHLITSSGANKNSLIAYLKIKAESEEAVSNLDFDKVAIYRPKMIVTKSSQAKTMEKISLALSKPFQYLTPTLLTTPIETLVKSMIENTLIATEKDTKKVEIIENCRIFELAKCYDQSKK